MSEHGVRTRRRSKSKRGVPVVSLVAIAIPVLCIFSLMLSGSAYINLVVPALGLSGFGLFLVLAAVTRRERPKALPWVAAALNALVLGGWGSYAAASMVALREFFAKSGGS